MALLLELLALGTTVAWCAGLVYPSSAGMSPRWLEEWVSAGLFFSPAAGALVMPGWLVLLICGLCAAEGRAGRWAVVRRMTLTALLIWLCIRAGTVFAPWHHRMANFAAAAERASPLVQAIGRFERDHRRPPKVLGELVPRYLPTVPDTGMCGYRDFRYKAPATDGDPPDRWELWIDCGWGMNFDMLYYQPLERYPEHGHGGRIERVGSWAYVHE
ncbi:MAG: hypothetical protein HYU66_28960 [Armatimonadetes bacterium]|nr:hypothetical protein [Armatimonadota bacterium]